MLLKSISPQKTGMHAFVLTNLLKWLWGHYEIILASTNVCFILSLKVLKLVSELRFQSYSQIITHRAVWNFRPHLYVCIHVCMCACIHGCIHVCVHVCILVYVKWCNISLLHTFQWSLLTLRKKDITFFAWTLLFISPEDINTTIQLLD